MTDYKALTGLWITIVIQLPLSLFPNTSAIWHADYPAIVKYLINHLMRDHVINRFFCRDLLCLKMNVIPISQVTAGKRPT